MPIAPGIAMAGLQGLNALAGIWGSNQAADAQEEAAKKQADLARRGMLYQTALNEPARYMGYQAMGDLASAFGYNMAPYQSAGQLQATMAPLSWKAVKAMLGRGMSVEDISQLGTLGGLNKKSAKKLTKAGLSADEIARLQQGPMYREQPTSPTSMQTQQPQNWQRFMDSPDYGFRRSEGIRGIEQGAAARGGALSGNALRGVANFSSNLAANEFGNWFNRRAQLAGYNTQANANIGNAATNTTNSLINAAGNQGDARASGILGTTNSIGNAINSGMNNYLMWQYMNRMPTQQPAMSPYGPYSGGYRFPGG